MHCRRLLRHHHGDPRGEAGCVGHVPAAFPVLAGHVQPVGAVAPQREDLEGPVGGEEVLHDAGVAHAVVSLEAVCEVTSHHPASKWLSQSWRLHH